jgi:hypothetical protein
MREGGIGAPGAAFIYIGGRGLPDPARGRDFQVFTLASVAVNETLIRFHDFSDFFNYI